mgnify:CR=1 FL=1
MAPSVKKSRGTTWARVKDVSPESMALHGGLKLVGKGTYSKVFSPKRRAPGESPWVARCSRYVQDDAISSRGLLQRKQMGTIEPNVEFIPYRDQQVAVWQAVSSACAQNRVLPTIHSVSFHDSGFVTIMESLQHIDVVLQQASRAEFASAFFLFLARGIRLAQETGIVHHDVSLNNIMARKSMRNRQHEETITLPSMGRATARIRVRGRWDLVMIDFDSCVMGKDTPTCSAAFGCADYYTMIPRAAHWVQSVIVRFLTDTDLWQEGHPARQHLPTILAAAEAFFPAASKWWMAARVAAMQSPEDGLEKLVEAAADAMNICIRSFYLYEQERCASVRAMVRSRQFESPKAKPATSAKFWREALTRLIEGEDDLATLKDGNKFVPVAPPDASLSVGSQQLAVSLASLAVTLGLKVVYEP